MSFLLWGNGLWSLPLTDQGTTVLADRDVVLMYYLCSDAHQHPLARSWLEGCVSAWDPESSVSGEHSLTGGMRVCQGDTQCKTRGLSPDAIWTPALRLIRAKCWALLSSFQVPAIRSVIQGEVISWETDHLGISIISVISPSPDWPGLRFRV